MRDGVCIKCGHATVYSGRRVTVKTSASNRLPIDFTHSAPFDNYVCTTCGYVERYISDADSLKRIETQWSPASKHKRK
ncbi:MAG: hypothetical protein ACFE0Q_15230 [Anaerolineae bacterium]